MKKVILLLTLVISFMAFESRVQGAQTTAISQVSTMSSTNLSLSPNNGNGIVRDSLGNYYAVFADYKGAQSIYVRKSDDGGLTWKVWNGSTYAATGETPLFSLSGYYRTYQYNPTLAVDGNNNVHLVWYGADPGPTVTQIRYMKYNGTSWSSVVNITSGESTAQSSPVVAADSNNNVYVVWSGNGQIRYSKYTTAWSAPVNLGAGTNPSIAIDSSNNVHVAASSGGQIAYLKYDGTTWSTPTNLTAGSNPSIAIDGSNNIHIALLSGGQIRYIEYTGSWSTPVNITTGSYTQYNPSITIDNNNNVYAIWYGYSSISPSYIQVRYSKYNGTTWTAACDVTAGSYNQQNVTVTRDASAMIWQGTTDVGLVSNSISGVMFSSLPPPAPNVNSLYGADVANNGDGRDIQVTFYGAQSETNVSEYRIYVIPSAQTGTVSVSSLSILSSSSYVTENKAGANVLHTLTLPQTLLDSSGVNILNGISYRVFVISVGQIGLANGLTQGMNSFTLQNPNTGTAAPATPSPITASDLGNIGDGRDIQVSFAGASNETNISQYRIYVVQSTQAGTFSAVSAIGLPVGEYLIENKTVSGAGHIIRLNQSLLDSTGITISSGTAYTVFVMSIGQNGYMNALSSASNSITITNTALPVGMPVVKDISDYGDGRDIKVSFNGSVDETGLQEYRVFVVPTAQAGLFSTATAAGLASTRYVSVSPSGVNTVHNLNLIQGLLDSTGAALANGYAYKIFVLSVGQSGYETSLSPAFGDFMLKIQMTTISQVSTMSSTNLSLSANNGRGIVRDSLGNYYAVFADAIGSNSIYVRKSDDGGLTWKVWNGSTYAATGETPLFSLSGYYHAYQYSPSLTVDGNNNIHLVWYGADSGPTVFMIKYMKYNGTAWSSVVNITPGASTSQTNPVVAADSNNNVYVVWSGNGQIRCSKYTTAWSAPVDLGAGTNPSITIDSSNNVHVAASSGGQIAYLKYDGTAWSTPINLTAGSNPSIAVDGGNNIHIALLSGGQIKYIEYTGFWSAPVNITTGSYTQYNPSITIDNNNNVYAIWYGYSSISPSYIQVRYSKYNGTTWTAACDATAGSYNQQNVTVTRDASAMIWQGTTDAGLGSNSISGVMFLTMPIPVRGVANLSVSDIDDKGDGRDISVIFTGIAEETNITAYRIIVVPASRASLFNVMNASNLASGRYLDEAINGNGASHTLQLTQSLLDSTGFSIYNGEPYKIFILSVAQSGNGNGLSVASNSIILTAPGIYVETTQSDFKAGTLTNTTATSTDNLELTDTSGGFAEDFEDTNYAAAFTGNWVLSNINPRTGATSFKSAAILDSQSTSTQVTVNLSKAGNVSFWYRVSSEAIYDKMYFYIDGGERLGGASGTVSWTQVSYSLTAGSHTLKWMYSKDSRWSRGEDSVYIDDLLVSGGTSSYSTTGTRVSPAIDVSGMAVAQASSINWAANTPTNTAITIQTNISLDGGTTWLGWQNAVNGSEIIGLGLGTNLANARLQYKETLSTTDTTVTPQLLRIYTTISSTTLTPNPAPITAASNALLDEFNFGDARDIRVIFKGANNETKIQEYRIIAAKTVLNEPTASALDNTRYQAEPVKGKLRLHLVNLSQTLNDSDGQAITGGINYTIYILSVSKKGYTNTLTSLGTINIGTNNIGFMIEAPMPTTADISNNGNGSDIRVSFKKPKSEANITSYRIIVSTIDLTLATAASVPAEGYKEITASNPKVSYTVSMGASQKIQDGTTAIQNDIPYKVYVLAVGKNGYANVLSVPSKTVTLSQYVPGAYAIRTLKAAKIGTGHDSSNITVSFYEPTIVSNVQEYRVFISPAGSVLSQTIAEGISDAVLYQVVPTTKRGVYHIVKLDAGKKDYNNAALAAGDYKIYVLTVGKAGYSGKLSAASGAVKLD